MKRQRPVLVIDTHSGDKRGIKDLAPEERAELLVELGRAVDVLARLSTFEGWLEMVAIERVCRQVVNADGGHTKSRDSIPWRATLTLEGLQQAREAIATNNADTAAAAALYAGYHFGIAMVLEAQSGRRSGGRARGAQIRAAAAVHDHEIARYARRWSTSDELKDQYRTPVSYIDAQTSIGKVRIRRRLATMGFDQ